MRKLFGKILISTVFFMFLALVAPNNVSACSSISKNPEAGVPGTKFVIEVSGCSKPNFSGYFLRVKRNSDNEEVVTQQLASNSDNPQTYTAVFNSPTPGEYEMAVWETVSYNPHTEVKDISASLVISPQNDNGKNNTYRCEPYQEKCKLYTLQDSCTTGYHPGNLCTTTPLGNCRNVEYPCTLVDDQGKEGQPCKSGDLCNAGLFCDLGSGFVCKRCGGAGEMCCPTGNTNQSLSCNAGNTCQNNVCVGNSENRGDQLGKQLLCNSGLGINTAIGCIVFDNANELVAFFLRWGVGLGGGIAFLLMVSAGFIIMTSIGNPQRLKAGSDLLTSAVTGLLMLLFSIFILRTIGVKILQIPGFGG